MQCQRVAKVAAYLAADAKEWSSAKGASVKLAPTPLGLQPTGLIRASWKERTWGQVSELKVAVVHDGNDIVFQLQWPDAEQVSGEGETFPDGAAIALPVKGRPPLVTMGEAGSPIHLLHWSASSERVRSVVAAGIGTSEEGPALDASAQASWGNGGWHLAVRRPLASPSGGAVLSAGSRTLVGFAVWNGANQERAGIKAFSIDWHELALEA